MKKVHSRTPVRVFESPDAIGEHVAQQLLELFDQARQRAKPFLLGCPTGRTPRPIYSALAKRLAQNKPDISHVFLVMMDEYVIKSENGFAYAPNDAAWSCHHFARVEMVDQLNRNLPSGRRVQGGQVWFPDARHPELYDEKIADAGGIDFFMLASGASDGHVAFNPPGSSRDSTTRIIELSESTRRDNLQTFPEFGSLSAVPTHGVSVGIATITAARQAVMVLTGSSKALSLARIVESSEYDSSWPATVIHECAGAEILCDADADQVKP